MNRPVQIDTPLGEGALLFLRMEGREELGRPFELQLELLSAQDDVDFTKVVGQTMTVHLEQADGQLRHFNGVCSRMSYGGTHGRYVRYLATLRPWMWLLTRTADCKIFQNKSAPDIIKEIFREQGQTQFEESLSRSYRVREYCVQYRETDFAFISRLMEEEGIYYFFKHEEKKHTLVLSDSYSAHSKIPGYEEVPFYPESEKARRERDHIEVWSASQQLEPGAYFLEDFDFERPMANLEVKLASQDKLAKKELEIYEYPGDYTQTADGGDLRSAAARGAVRPAGAGKRGGRRARSDAGRAVHADELPARGSESRVPGGVGAVRAELRCVRVGALRRAGGVPLRLHRDRQPAALPLGADHAAPRDPGPADRHRGGQVGRGDLDRQARAREAAVPLGSRWASPTRRARAGCGSRRSGRGKAGAASTSRGSARR